jgi:hypothetical protein
MLINTLFFDNQVKQFILHTVADCPSITAAVLENMVRTRNYRLLGGAKAKLVTTPTGKVSIYTEATDVQTSKGTLLLLT